MAEQLRKRCLYEVIGVSRESSPDEIRSAYRRLALQLHPDKIAAANGGTTSPAATAAFQELLHAYEVLSDPRERAYYDSHRSQILFSDPSSTSKSHKSSFFNVDLYSYFTNSAFSGFSDTGRGFYKVYGDLFAKLYAQELWFVKELNLDAISPAPLIGNLNSPYTQVTAFYNYWLSFNTVLDFGWVDEYDASMGPDRRSRRQMEEENKKARKKAKREYIDSVRGLAAFAKKRDKRVIDMQLKKKLEEEKRREEEKAKKKEEARKRMERAVAFEEPEWARVDEVEDTADESGDERRGKGREEFYCVVCNKKFKSDKQWKNHEQSKKHRDKVADLKTSFKDEEGSIVSDDVEDTSAGFDYVPSEEVEDTDSDAVDDLCEDMKDDLGLEEEVEDVPLRDRDQKKVEDVPLRDRDQKEVEDAPLRDSDQKEVEDVPLRDSDQNADSVEEASVLEAMLTGRKNRKSGYAGRDVNHENDAMMQDTRKKNRKARRRAITVAGLEVTSEEPNGASEDQNGFEDKDQIPDDVGQGPSSSVEEVEPVRKSKEAQVIGKNQKNKKVDVKLAANKDKNVDLKPASKGKKQKGNSKVPNTLCDTCGQIFDTRNKLFAHLGETGHAMLKSK